MTSLSEILLGQKCRPMGASPRPADARPEDYFYTVVACWLDPCAFSQGDPTPVRYRLTCAVVAELNGVPNVLPFLDLEFSDLEFE